VRQRPPKRLRGVVQRRPLLLTAGDSPKTAVLAFTAPVLMRRLGSGRHPVCEDVVEKRIRARPESSKRLRPSALAPARFIG
jgi:hypothetical protein